MKPAQSLISIKQKPCSSTSKNDFACLPVSNTTDRFSSKAALMNVGRSLTKLSALNHKDSAYDIGKFYIFLIRFQFFNFFDG